MYAALVVSQIPHAQAAIRPRLKLSITNYTWTTVGLNPRLRHEQRERTAATSYVQTFRLTAGLQEIDTRTVQQHRFNATMELQVYQNTQCPKKIVPFFFYFFFPRCPVCGEWCKLH